MSLDLKTDNHLKLARNLSELLIKVIESKDELGDGPVAVRLRQLRDAVWPANGKPLSQEDLKFVFENQVKGLDAEQKKQLIEAYARMGHLYEIAGLVARKNYFDLLETENRTKIDGLRSQIDDLERTGKRAEAAKLREEMDPILRPGGVTQFINKQMMQAHKPEAAYLTEQLNQPVFEVVMTMHPTNTNSLESMRAQRELAEVLERGGDARAVKAALEKFERSPLLHQVNGKDGYFTVRDETEVVLNYLKNIYDDLPKIYSQYDKPMAAQFGDQYKPDDLKLNMRFGSWGSAGDKDGNNSVTAETTLEAIALHTQAIVEKYKKELEGIEGLGEWKQKLSTASDYMNELVLPRIEELRRRSDKLRLTEGAKSEVDAMDLNAHFDSASSALRAVRNELNAKEFEADLEKSYHLNGGDEQKKILDLLRKVRVFGFNFAKIEYRETAKDYHRVVDTLLNGHTELPPEMRERRMTQLLQYRKLSTEALEYQYDQIIKAGAAKAYDDKDANPIAYHTIKRMELARDFPEMIRDNVLAECGRIDKDEFQKSFGRVPTAEDVKMVGTVNILEAQFLQKALEKDGRRPLLGIVPLFEEPDTMQNIDGIMDRAYSNPAYREHMKLLRERNGGQDTQQVQIAHSDNARRSGLLGARALIHEAHKKMRDVNERHHIKTQFFEGGSISDAYRNGVRAISASVNAFGLQDFAKFTFQGGDLVNFFSVPSSNMRLFTRNIVKPAERFHKEGTQWTTQPREGTELFDGDRAKRQARTPVSALDDIAITALKQTLDDYQQQDFKDNKMGILLAALDYNAEIKAGMRGSRNDKRGAKSKPAAAFVSGPGKSVKVDMGIAKAIEVDNVRTIGFSEAWQHGGIVPSWIGSQGLADHLYQAVKAQVAKIQSEGSKGDDDAFVLKEFGNLGNQGLTARQINLIYEKSPTFRDAQDRAAFALAMTDPESFKWLESRLQRHAKGELQSDGLAYLRQVKDTFVKAGYLALAAVTRPKADEDVHAEIDKHFAQREGGHARRQYIRDTAGQALEQLTDDIRRKSNYRDFLQYMKIWGRINRGDKEQVEHLRAAVHNGIDTVVHGRFVMVDDPAYGGHRVQSQKKEKAASVAAIQ